MNLNPKNKPNKWIVILGAPNLTNQYWEGRTPDGDQLEDHWLKGEIFSSKLAAQKVADKEYKREENKYLVRVQKYNSRIVMKKTF